MRNEILNPVSDSTLSHYVSNVKCKEYGIAYRGKKRQGTKGECHYVFCKELEDGSLAHFTEEELKIKKQLQDKYFKLSNNKCEMMQQLLQARKDKEITAEEFEQEVENFSLFELGWSGFQMAFEKAIGYKVGFYQELETRAWEEE